MPTELPAGRRGVQTAALTSVALVAFASNSVLNRQALGGATIDAASFSTIRLLAGAVTLLLISVASGRGGRRAGSRGNWISAALLFLYAAGFSFAYDRLSTATGALILFGAVQGTMVLAALWSGERPRAVEWTGLLLALGGLVYLVSPGLTAPSPAGSALMAASGICWGGYSLRGSGTGDPLGETTYNFLRTVPMAMALTLATLGSAKTSLQGILLAVLSGSLASGVGYVVWYAALRGLSKTRAATVQLSVPVLAAIGGVIFLAESISTRLFVSAFVILGGVGLAVTQRFRN